METPPLDDPVVNLEVISLYIRPSVTHALQASMIRTFAGASYATYKARYRTNPSNNLHSIALASLEATSLVRISEVLKEGLLGPIPEKTEIRRKADLVLHRHSVSHPVMVKWSDPRMQEFTKAKRPQFDSRPALIWDMQRSINDELRTHKREVHLDTIPVTPDMATLLRSITACAVKASEHAWVLSEAAFYKYLQLYRDDYLLYLEGMPDGRRKAPAPEIYLKKP